MSREIKFRAWNEDAREMFYWGIGDVNDDGSTCTFPSGQSVHFPQMQFTGLTDKNGVEIYEGDLLRIPAKDIYEETTYNCFEVFYHDNECIGGINIGFCMNRMHTQGNSAGGRGYKFTPESINKFGFEVIGNIYESPELLEATS